VLALKLLKGRIAAFCLVSLILGSGLLGCTSQMSFSPEDYKKAQEQPSATSNTDQPSTTSNAEQASTTDNTGDPIPASDPSPAPTSGASPTDNVPASTANDPLPPGYILDRSCDKGTGQTGLDIYYKLPPSDFVRYACVHRVDASPYIDYGGSTFAQKLADVGGSFCAFSTISKNVGCALSPISPIDLMNVPPQQEEQEKPTPKQQPVQAKQSVQGKQPTSEQQPSPSNTGTGGLSNDNYYTNSKDNEVHTPAQSTDGSVPPGATARCKDGDYSFSQSRSGTCSSHDGVSQWLP
jgi:outer membrane biosynthesis protein TonB